MQERRLLGELTRTAYETTRAFLPAQSPGLKGSVPYFVSSAHTFGCVANVQHRSYYLALSHPPLELVFREKRKRFSQTAPLEFQLSRLEEPLDDPVNRFGVEI